MATLAERFRKWSVEELNLVSEGGDIPDLESFKLLTKGKQNKDLWTYVINHVRSKATVAEIKNTLRLKKLLREKQDKMVSFNEVKADVAKLQTAVSRSNEKSTSLTDTLSAIEGRILSLEQTIENINEDTAKINQKSAFLELLKKKYDDKSALMKILSSQIVFHMDYLRSYESSYLFSNQSDLSHRLVYGNLNTGTDFKLKEFYSTSLAIIKMKLSQSDEKEVSLLENLQKQNCELKNTGLRLTDLVIFLKNMSDFDMQQFFASSSQSVSVKDFVMCTSQTQPVKQLLSQIKYNNVQDDLCIVRNAKKNDQLLVNQGQVFKDYKIEDSENNNEFILVIKLRLFKKLAENEALVISNNFLEEYLKDISRKAEELKESCEDEITYLNQQFYKNADLTFYLSNTVPDVFQKILNDFSKLQSFAQNELFVSQSYLYEEPLADVCASIVSDRKLMWKYCKMTNMIEPLYSKPYNIDYPLSSEVRKLFIIQPFEHVCTICRKLIGFKETLKSEVMSYDKAHTQRDDVSTSETHVKFMEILDKGKCSIEKGRLFINGSLVSHSNKNKILIQEWWEQNAQFIPSIEHEGKTLKMWIDILRVLIEFEPASLKS